MIKKLEDIQQHDLLNIPNEAKTNTRPVYPYVGHLSLTPGHILMQTYEWAWWRKSWIERIFNWIEKKSSWILPQKQMKIHAFPQLHQQINHNAKYHKNMSWNLFISYIRAFPELFITFPLLIIYLFKDVVSMWKGVVLLFRILLEHRNTK